MFFINSIGVDCGEQPDTQRIFTRTELASILTQQGVIWRDWGVRPGTRTFTEFCNYHQRDQFYINKGTDGGIVLNVHAAIVLVYHKIGLHELELYEDRIIEPNGDVIRRSSFNGISETLNHGEEPIYGGYRCLSEELKFHNPAKFSFLYSEGVEICKPRDSEKWPNSNVKAIYHRNIFSTVISDELFQGNGYIEKEKNGRKIVFRWRLRRPLTFMLS